jgi:hypothetical protein
MENNIDQFFKDKMEGHSLPPSQEAWGKVEANLSKKNNVASWRIAAAVLISGALISLLIWSQQDSVKNKPATVAGILPKDNSIRKKTTAQNSSNNEKGKIESSDNKSSIKLSTSKIQALPNQNKKDESEKVTPKTQTTIVETSDPKPAAVKETNKEEKINTEATRPATIASTKQKPIKLEFTLDDYSSDQPVATVSEEKNSGLKKVWNLAREVKNGDGPVREIKNELFALNFKKNKNQ